MKKLNSKERVLTTFNHEEPDQVPLFTSSIDSNHVVRGYTGKNGALSNVAYDILKKVRFIPGWKYSIKFLFGRRFIQRAGIKAIIKLYEKIGIDLMMTPVCLLPIGKSAGFNFSKPGLTTPSWTNMTDEFGRIQSFYYDKETDLSLMNYMGGAFDAETLEEVMSNYEKWAPLDPDIKSRYYTYEEGVKIAGEDGPYVIPAITGLLEVTWQSLGFENYAKLLFEHPDFIEEVTNNNYEFSRAVIERLIEKYNVELINVYDDQGYKTGTFLSPRQYMKLIHPKMKSLVKLCHDNDVKIIHHTCGNINKILDKVIGTGIDGLNPLEPAASMDIFQVKRDFGDKITLIGNVDPIHLLGKGTPAEVDEYVKKLIKSCAPGGGLIVSSGHSIHPAVPFENYDAMVQATKKYGKYPIKI